MDRKISIVYDTLSDMLQDENLVGGMTVKTLGGDTVGDGSGRIFKVYDSSMGIIYNKDKHIKLKRRNPFAEIVEDNPLYNTIRALSFRVNTLESSDAKKNFDLVQRTYPTLADFQADITVESGMFVKTMGEEEPGDGGARTYAVVDYDVEHGYKEDQIILDNRKCA